MHSLAAHKSSAGSLFRWCHACDPTRAVGSIADGMIRAQSFQGAGVRIGSGSGGGFPSVLECRDRYPRQERVH